MNSFHTNKQSFSKTAVFCILVLLLAAGSFLRFWNLGNTSFWVDEVNTIYAAGSLAAEGNYELPSGLEHGRAPLHLFLTSLAYRIMEPDEYSTRFISALFGVFNILAVFIFCKRFFNVKIGLIAAFMMTFSFFEIGWSRTARVYPVLQFFTLFFAYTFLMAAGYKKSKDIAGLLKIKGDSFFSNVKLFFGRWGISPIWFFPAGLIFLISYLYLHELASFWIFSVLVFSVFLAIVFVFAEEKKSDKLFNFYSILSFLILLSGIIVFAGAPSIREKIVFFLSYTPPWADGLATGGNRLNLVYSLMSGYRIPLFTLFFIGSVQAFFRYNKRAVFMFFMFICQIFLLSFVFTHNTEMYMFNVYPFFLILAAYGFYNVMDIEILISRKLLSHDIDGKSNIVKNYNKGLSFWIAAAFFSVFILTPWLRISLHIPFNPDGMTNGAVTTSGWKEASKKLLEISGPDDVILTSIPILGLYYGVESDYALNWTLLNQAKEKDSKNTSGDWVDVYAGVKCVSNLDNLKQIIQNNKSGWILVESYQWEHDPYIPDIVRTYVEKTFDKPFSFANHSILLFHWNSQSGKI